MSKINEPIILFEDQDIVVINKPAGVVVNRAETTREQTLQDWFAQKIEATSDPHAGVEGSDDWSSLVPPDFDASFGSPEAIFAERLGMVHRLDKDTSGVMVWAKNPGALVHLLAQFKQRLVQKTYLCLTHGKFSLPVGSISAPLGRASQDRKIFAVQAEGRPAITDYQVLENFRGFSWELLEEVLALQPQWLQQPEKLAAKLKELKQKLHLYQGFSLVECQPKTGRTHQIRVHLKHLHHPLVGDAVYVGKKRATLDALWCPRQFLHASELRLTHPRTGVELVFAAELQPDLITVLSLLEK